MDQKFALSFLINLSDSPAILENDWLFWPIYLFIALIVTIILIAMPCFALTLTCAVLGGFTVVLSIAYFANSNLVYIIINVIRRLTVSWFNYAIVSFPLQSKGNQSLNSFLLFALVIDEKKRRQKYEKILIHLCFLFFPF